MDAALSEKLPLEIGGVDFAEHSKHSRAKKVVEGPLFIPQHATEPRTVDPVEKGSDGTYDIAQNKAYRLISDGTFRYRLSVGASAGAVTDIYVPANAPIIIATRDYNKISIKSMAGTFVQWTEVR